MTPFLIDTHSHIHFPPFAQDRAEVLLRMRARGIATITIGTSLGTSQSGIQFAEGEPDVWASVGLHPEHLTSSFEDDAEGVVAESSLDSAALRRLVQSSSKVVAVGETGLDFFRIDEGMSIEDAAKLQEASFREHLLVAHENHLPVVIHCRDALTRLAEVLQDEWNAGRIPRGIVHSFTGTWKEAKPLLDLGCFIAVNGIATFPPRKTQLPEQAIDRTIEQIPFDRLLVETDAPYLAPAPYRGKRNEPAYVEEVAKHIAGVRRTSLEQVAKQTTENAVKAFGLPC